ncbi:MAG TPA: hypothetical protein VFI31_15485, partial [Pirellulales bacterium]|nr:hypothetical protein [Pirellulales bacterium]
GSFLSNNPQIVLDKNVNGNKVFGEDGIPTFQQIGGLNTLTSLAPAPVDFGDLFPLPIIFEHVATSYSSNVWGIELMRTGWLSKSRRGDRGDWDWMAGARYIRFRDQFTFSGTGDVISGNATILSGPSGATTTGPYVSTAGLLADTQFAQTAANYMVGPQVGLRWTKQRGRLSWNTEARFMAAGNFQTIRQVGSVAQQTDINAAHYTHLPIVNNFTQLTMSSSGGSTNNVLAPVQVDTPFLHPATVYHVSHPIAFSPIGEFRFDMRYQIFRNIQATVGWTGMVLGGIARSTNMVSYTLPDMGIVPGRNQQVMFIQGLNFGFTVNR